MRARCQSRRPATCRAALPSHPPPRQAPAARRRARCSRAARRGRGERQRRPEAGACGRCWGGPVVARWQKAEYAWGTLPSASGKKVFRDRIDRISAGEAQHGPQWQARHRQVEDGVLGSRVRRARRGSDRPAAPITFGTRRLTNTRATPRAQPQPAISAGRRAAAPPAASARCRTCRPSARGGRRPLSGHSAGAGRTRDSAHNGVDARGGGAVWRGRTSTPLCAESRARPDGPSAYLGRLGDDHVRDGHGRQPGEDDLPVEPFTDQFLAMRRPVA